jgi:hypothetical protein
MTENEAIKHLRHIIWCMGNEPPENLKDWRDIQEWEDEHNKLKQTYETSIQVLEEIQEYREIGTVEEFKALKEKKSKKKKSNKVIFTHDSYAYCPHCKHCIELFKPSYCDECGGELDWQ